MANAKHLKMLMRGVKAWNNVKLLTTFGFSIKDEELAAAANASGLVYGTKLDLSGISLTSTDLSGINLSYVNLADSNLSFCVLDDAEFRDTELSNATLEHASLRNADFEDANLRGSKLLGAQLQSASLIGVVLEAADIRGAVMDDDSIKRSLWSDFNCQIWLRGGGRIISNASTAGAQVSKQGGAAHISTPAYDIFISHASEDKDEIARPLHDALIKHGLKIWFDEATLKLGDNLRRTIDEGLAKCRYGIVIFSPFFLNKEWPLRELDGLVARETLNGNKAILPIWHNIDKATLLQYSPTLADRLAARSSDGIPSLVNQILKVLRG